MSGRIITLQRQARELGRLRTGYTDTSGAKPRPVRSQTWIISSHAEHYVQAAAEVWGGTPEKWQPLGNGAAQWRVVTETPTLDAILPPGDPLSQSYEQWSRGGAQRRCDGMTEGLSDQPCLCRAQWGDAFYEAAPRDAACKVTTRLNVILPEMPDIGAWRVETHSYYSANEMAAAVDVMKGAIGDAALIPIRLRIEQRTRVAEGKTKQFPVVAVELRGSTAGQLLAGAVPGMKAVAASERQAVEAPERTAIEAPAEGPAEPVAQIDREIALVKACTTLDQLSSILQQALGGYGVTNLGRLPKPLQEAFAKAKDLLTNALPKSQGGCPCDVHDGEHSACNPGCSCTDEPAPADADALWAQIVAAWPGNRTDEIEEAFAKANGGEVPATATPEALAAFLADVQAGRIKPKTDDGVPF